MPLLFYRTSIEIVYIRAALRKQHFKEQAFGKSNIYSFRGDDVDQFALYTYQSLILPSWTGLKKTVGRAYVRNGLFSPAAGCV